jgi:hypothetical protein
MSVAHLVDDGFFGSRAYLIPIQQEAQDGVRFFVVDGNLHPPRDIVDCQAIQGRAMWLPKE